MLMKLTTMNALYPCSYGYKLRKQGYEHVYSGPLNSITKIKSAQHSPVDTVANGYVHHVPVKVTYLVLY